MKIKFEIGQKVRVIADGEVGEVISFSANSKGVFYQITSKEVDVQAKEIINGFKTCSEKELEEVKEEK